MEGFTRQEAIALTRTTSSRLAYLDRVKVVVPQKFGNSKKPVVIYSGSIGSRMLMFVVNFFREIQGAENLESS